MPTVPLTAAAAEMMTNLGTMLMKCIRVRRAMVAALMTMRETSPNALSFDILASSLSTGTDPNEYERVGTPCYVEQEMMVLEHLMLVQSALDRYDFKVVALSMHLAGQALKRVEVDIGLLQQENGTVRLSVSLPIRWTSEIMIIMIVFVKYFIIDSPSFLFLRFLEKCDSCSLSPCSCLVQTISYIATRKGVHIIPSSYSPLFTRHS